MGNRERDRRRKTESEKEKEGLGEKQRTGGKMERNTKQFTTTRGWMEYNGRVAENITIGNRKGKGRAEEEQTKVV